jgi:GNAT superfamily N-acetyltransferase
MLSACEDRSMQLELVRVQTPEQAELWRELRNEGQPEPITRETYVRLREMAPHTLDLIAYADGGPVGVGVAAISLIEPDGPCAAAGAYVRPAWRGRGIGTALYTAVSAHARTLGKDELEAVVVRDDPDGLRFLERRGFRIVSRVQLCALDLATASIPEARPEPEVEVVSLAERPDAVHGMYEVALEALVDIPGEQLTVGPFEDWQRNELERPRAMPELSFVAIVDGVVAGYATLGDYGDRQGLHLMTGVRRSARGRGLAGMLKRTQIAAAHEAGLRRLVAFNNDANEPIKRLNDALGYVAQSPATVLRGPPAAT